MKVNFEILELGNWDIAFDSIYPTGLDSLYLLD